MTQLLPQPEQTAAVARLRTGVVFVPCVICRKAVDLAAVTEANDPPICGEHFLNELPWAEETPAQRYR